MKNFSRIFLTGFIFITGCTLLCCTASQPTEKKAKAIFIILDGVPADVVEKLNLPTLQEISKAGGYTRAYVGGKKATYNETPTISAPGYISLLTGTWGNKHNVWDNDIAAPNYNYWNIFRIAEKNNPNLHTAVFSTWLDNRTKLIGEGLEKAGAITLDHKFDGLEHDTVKYPHDETADYIRKIDEAVVEETVRYISAEGPDLSWVYLEYTDDMGHRFGDSPQFYQAIENADRQFKNIWEAIKLREEKFNEDWLLIITTDHGRNIETGKDHGGQSDRERTTWITTNSKLLNDRFKQSPAVVDILPSILNHLSVKIPDDVNKEIDGVPFIGAIDLADLSAQKNGDTVKLEWKNFSKNKSDLAEVFVSETNKFKEDQADTYEKTGEVPLHQEHYDFILKKNSPFLKILVKGPHHYSNVWVVDSLK
jgi:predicted AlkP superfamily pyrophosphatase or phosphodiesterase